MNLKNFIICGIAGGIADWLLGWLFYGEIFKIFFPMDEGTMNMGMITLGCFTVGFFIAYILLKWANISNVISGLKAGAIIGVFQGLTSGFFANEATLTPNYSSLALGVFISIVMCACVGGVVALVNRKI